MLLLSTTSTHHCAHTSHVPVPPVPSHLHPACVHDRQHQGSAAGEAAGDWQCRDQPAHGLEGPGSARVAGRQGRATGLPVPHRCDHKPWQRPKSVDLLLLRLPLILLLLSGAAFLSLHNQAIFLPKQVALVCKRGGGGWAGGWVAPNSVQSLSARGQQLTWSATCLTGKNDIGPGGLACSIEGGLLGWGPLPAPSSS